jgi:malate dehydrogenase (oxaloacetate-decarboxylating)(NADP+)
LVGHRSTNAKRVTDEMFTEAAHAVADQVTPEQLKLGMPFPPQSNILEVEVQTAARVAKLVFDAGLARVDRPAIWWHSFGGTFTNPSTKYLAE